MRHTCGKHSRGTTERLHLPLFPKTTLKICQSFIISVFFSLSFDKCVTFWWISSCRSPGCLCNDQYMQTQSCFSASWNIIFFLFLNSCPEIITSTGVMVMKPTYAKCCQWWYDRSEGLRWRTSNWSSLYVETNSSFNHYLIYSWSRKAWPGSGATVMR